MSATQRSIDSNKRNSWSDSIFGIAGLPNDWLDDPDWANGNNDKAIMNLEGYTMMKREEILNQLREGVTTVTFTKKNGDERVMDCTLNMDLIPVEARPKTDGNSFIEGVEATVSAIKCYDVKAEGWRSFLIDNVSKINENSCVQAT